MLWLGEPLSLFLFVDIHTAKNEHFEHMNNTRGSWLGTVVNGSVLSNTIKRES